MAEFMELAKINELSDGQMKMFTINEHEYLLARVGDAYYAADNHCPHMGGNLSQGKLEGTIVTCPRHHSKFDLKDGHVIRWTDWTGLKLALGKIARSPRPLKTYPVKMEGDKILAGIGEKVPAGVHS